MTVDANSRGWQRAAHIGAGAAGQRRAMATAVMTSLRTKFLGKAEARVLFVGLDGGGKSTILYRLKNGTVNESEIIRAPRTAHPDAPLARR